MVSAERLLGMGIEAEGAGNESAARDYFGQAARKGNLTALVRFGASNLMNPGGDVSQGIVALRQSVDRGGLSARDFLVLLAARRCLEQSAWADQAATSGDLLAMAAHGQILAAQGDPSEAKIWLRRAVDGGQEAALVPLGKVCVLLDEKGEARYWFTRAAEAGDEDAQAPLMETLSGIRTWGSDDWAKAEPWLRLSADDGNANALFYMGVALSQRGDISGAIEWYRRAADSGEKFALCNLGLMYSKLGDLAQARRWYTRGAESGDSLAMLYLGGLLEKEGDRAGARTWYVRAAAEGSDEAAARLESIDDQARAQIATSGLQEQAPASRARFCSECGSALTGSGRFCANCGAAIAG